MDDQHQRLWREWTASPGDEDARQQLLVHYARIGCQPPLGVRRPEIVRPSTTIRIHSGFWWPAYRPARGRGEAAIALIDLDGHLREVTKFLFRYGVELTLPPTLSWCVRPLGWSDVDAVASLFRLSEAPGLDLTESAISLQQVIRADSISVSDVCGQLEWLRFGSANISDWQDSPGELGRVPNLSFVEGPIESVPWIDELLLRESLYEFRLIGVPPDSEIRSDSRVHIGPRPTGEPIQVPTVPAMGSVVFNARYDIAGQELEGLKWFHAIAERFSQQEEEGFCLHDARCIDDEASHQLYEYIREHLPPDPGYVEWDAIKVMDQTLSDFRALGVVSFNARFGSFGTYDGQGGVAEVRGDPDRLRLIEELWRSILGNPQVTYTATLPRSPGLRETLDLELGVAWAESLVARGASGSLTVASEGVEHTMSFDEVEAMPRECRFSSHQRHHTNLCHLIVEQVFEFSSAYPEFDEDYDDREEHARLAKEHRDEVTQEYELEEPRGLADSMTLRWDRGQARWSHEPDQCVVRLEDQTSLAELVHELDSFFTAMGWPLLADR